MPTPHDVAQQIESRLAPLEAAAGRAWWAASVDASAANDRLRIDAEVAYTAALSDAEAFASVGAALADVDAAADPQLHRRLALLHLQMASNQVDPVLNERLITLGTDVDSTFSSFRGTVGERRLNDNEINEILHTSDEPSERRAAWEASKQVGAAVAERVLDLVRLRNEVAVRLGYRDHFAMSLSLSELDEERLFATLDEADRVSAAPFAAWKAEVDAGLADRFGCAVDDLRPWHYDNVFFQSPPSGSGVDLDALFVDRDLVDLTRRTYASIGVDIEPIVAASDLDPREGKNQHAFCADIDRSGDIRVLCNNVPGEEWAGVMLHEFGHAIYDAGLDRTLPWGLRTVHPLTTEGIAMMFESLGKDAQWLTTMVGADPAELADVQEPLERDVRAGLLTFCRWVLVVTNFERGLYADPEADHDTRWWDLVERYQLLRRPDHRAAPDWAAKIHIASSPVYYQNYLLGQLVALQLGATITERFGGLIGDERIGDFLRDEVFAPGASIRWDHLIERVTGHPLTAAHLAEAIAG